jgi:hypothetical protein
VLEYSTGDADRPTDVHGKDAPSGRPDDWVAPEGSAVAAAPPESLTLSYRVTLQDMLASVRDPKATRKLYEAQLSKSLWLRSVPMLALAVGLTLATNLFMFELDVTASVLSTALIGALFVVVRWSQIDHVRKRALPAALERQSLRELSQRGDERRIAADAGGVVLADAASTARVGWGQVHLAETEQHILLTVEPVTWAIPRSLGEPLAAFVQFARNHGAR